MKLSSAARAFDDVQCLDAYTDRWAFNAQLGLFDDTKRDSETAERRVLSVSPHCDIPARRVIKAANKYFIIGQGQPDSFRGQVIRVGYIAHDAPYLARIRSLAQVVMDQLGTTAYAGMAWVKNMAYSSHSSELTPEFHIHFASTEVVPDTSVLTLGAKSFIVRTSNLGAAGMLVTTCDELQEPVIEVGSIVNGVYSVMTDSVVGTPTPIRVLRVRWQSLFAYASQQAPKFGPEDMAVVTPASVAVVAGAKLTLSDGTWYVASSSSFLGARLHRVTRHGQP